MIKALSDLQSKEMNRADFLRFVGVALLLLTGVSRMMRSLDVLSKGSSQSGYGSSPYGQ